MTVCAKPTSASEHAEACLSQDFRPSTHDYTFNVAFVQDFNVTVLAFYKSPDSTELLSSSSKTLDYNSGVGPPSQEPKITCNVGNGAMTLVWGEPSVPNGPINYYIVEVSDALNKTNIQP